MMKKCFFHLKFKNKFPSLKNLFVEIEQLRDRQISLAKELMGGQFPQEGLALEMFAKSVLARCKDVFDAIVLMVKENKVVPIYILLRAHIETLYIVNYAYKDPEYLRDFMETRETIPQFGSIPQRWQYLFDDLHCFGGGAHQEKWKEWRKKWRQRKTNPLKELTKILPDIEKIYSGLCNWVHFGGCRYILQRDSSDSVILRTHGDYYWDQRLLKEVLTLVNDTTREILNLLDKNKVKIKLEKSES